MKFALAQMEVVPGKPQVNTDKMLEMIEDAKKLGVEVIVFPEMCVGGYLLGDRWLDPEICRDFMDYNEEIRKASEGICVIYGNIYVDSDPGINGEEKGWHPNKDGRVRKYNAAYIYQNTKPAIRSRSVKHLPEGVQPKTLLPTYRIFDDERYFFSLEGIAKDFGIPLEDVYQPFLISTAEGEKKLGLEICEDLWVADYRKDLNPINPSKYLIENGADLLINLSASPWTYRKNDARDRRVKFLKTTMDKESSKDFVPLLYVGHTGAQNNGKNIVTFDGGTTVYNNEGFPVLFDNPYNDGFISFDSLIFQEEGEERKKKLKVAQKNIAIVEGIKHMRTILGWSEHPKFIVGLSGGIDSSVVATLIVQALGKDHVMGVNMPTKYNTEKTKTSARLLAEALGIPYMVVPVEELAQDITEKIEKSDFPGKEKELSQLTKENIQAKIRGTTILSNLSAKYGALFTNNGNKLEIALGYATLYGDVGGAISPIGDLTKAETYEMARYLNDHIFKKEVISSDLIPDELFRFKDDQIPPSAELKEDQIDPMKFGYHDAVLEAFTDYKKKGPYLIAKWYFESTLSENLGVSESLLKRWGLDDPNVFIQDLEWFTKLYYRSVYKRVQAPPNIITSRSAFGYDIRETQLPWEPSKAYRKLKRMILDKNKTD